MDPSTTSKDIPCRYFCTHAITGSTHPAHQPIYICETCRLSSNLDDGDGGVFCLCECCAEVCHEDHNVEFVGVGPCTCDCFRLSCSQLEPNIDKLSTEPSDRKRTAIGADVCKLVEASREEAHRLGFNDEIESRKLNDPIPMRIPPVYDLLSSIDDFDADSNEQSEAYGLHDTIKSTETNEEDRLAEWTTDQCIECNSSIGGYTFDCFTIPSLSSLSTGVELCQRLIRQAEALVEESRDTFWLPIDDQSSSKKDGDLCDLELLAREIYQRHVNAYNLIKNGFEEKESINDKRRTSHLEVKNGAVLESTTPGAEWWVQVKPAGSSKGPVDIHYDKDEELAESFCLGSFPTLSTVTYLTGNRYDDKIADKDDGKQQKGGMDEAPTVIFPHTYHDDEDQVISAMILSRPVRGKHIVFDGRLLHGAPGHPALRPNQGRSTEDNSPLRVTFLVNIWLTGRPAGVHILPQSIRSKIQSAPMTLPLEFDRRIVTQYSAPSKLSMAFSGGDLMTSQVILPFVSKGATWISDDEEQDDMIDNGGSIVDETSAKLKSDGVEAIHDNEKENDEDELFLQLPHFVTSEYLNDGVDIAMFLFQSGNEARLVRQGVGEEIDSASLG